MPPVLVWLGWSLPPVAAANTPPAAAVELTAPFAVAAPPARHDTPRDPPLGDVHMTSQSLQNGKRTAPAPAAWDAVAAVASPCLTAAAAFPARPLTVMTASLAEIACDQ